MSIPGGLPGWSLPARRLAAYAPLSCAGLRLSKNFPLPCPPLFVPSSVPKAGAKVLPFSHSASTFFNYFFTFLHHADLQYYIFTYFTRKNLKQRQECPFSHPKKNILPSVFDEKSIKTVQIHTKLCARKRTCFRHTLLI